MYALNAKYTKECNFTEVRWKCMIVRHMAATSPAKKQAASYSQLQIVLINLDLDSLVCVPVTETNVVEGGALFPAT